MALRANYCVYEKNDLLRTANSRVVMALSGHDLRFSNTEFRRLRRVIVHGIV